MSAKEITLYTDGSCYPNPGPGGWGAIIVTNGIPRHALSGNAPDTTNNRMELTSVLEGLKYLYSSWELEKHSHVRVVTDSQYVSQAFSENWISKWKHSDWTTVNGEPVKNKDLWLELAEATYNVEQQMGQDISWSWIRGHDGNFFNEQCDRIALRARMEVGHDG